jgi:hypothetical protein
MDKTEVKPFSGLRFPIYDVPPGTDLVHKFKELQDYPEFAMYKHADRNYVIRYVIFCYDMGSDLIKKYTDLTKRKEAAALLAGFERNEKTGKFKDEVYNMMNLKKQIVKIKGEEGEKDETEVESNKIYEMVMCYIKLQNDRLWSMIITTEQAFSEYQGLIMEPVSERGDKDTLAAVKIKDGLMDSCDRMHERISTYYKQLFGDNEDLKEVIKKKPIRPETVGRNV